MGGKLGLLCCIALGFFIDGLFYGVTIPLTPQSPAGITEEWMFGGISTAYSVGVLGATLLAAIFSDRLGRRLPMVAGSLIKIGAIWIFGYAETYAQMLVSRCLMGAASAILWTIGLAILSESFQKKRSQVFGYILTANSLGLVLGPITAGYLSEVKGFLFPVQLLLVIALTDLVTRFVILKDPVRSLKKESELLALIHDRAVIGASVTIVLGAWCWCVLEALLPNHLMRAKQFSPTLIGAIFTVGCLVHAFASPIAGTSTDRRGICRTLFIGFGVTALILPTFSYATQAWAIAVILSISNIGYAFMMNPAMTELSEVIDRRGTGAYASVFAIYNIAYSIGMSGSGLLAGFSIAHFSFGTTLILSSLTILLCGPFVIQSFSNKRLTGMVSAR